jgi:hypothetical protein
MEQSTSSAGSGQPGYLNRFVASEQKFLWNRKPESPRGLEIDCKQ